MNIRWNLMVIAVIYVLMLLYSMKTLLTGSFGMSAMMTLLPFIVIIAFLAINALSAYQVGLIVGTQAMVTYVIPLPLFDRLSVGMLTGLMLMGIYFITSAMNKEKTRLVVYRGFPSVMLAITAVVVVVRFLVDRPGSARLGHVGGAGEAVSILLAMAIFFVGSKLCANAWDATKNYRAALIISIIAYAPLGVEMIKRLIYNYEQMNLYTVPMFSLGAFILVYLIEQSTHSNRPRYKIGSYLMMGLLLLASYVSARRAAPFAALASILVIVYCYKQMRRLFLVVLVVAPVLFGYFILKPEKIPLSMARTLSTVLPTSATYNLKNKYYMLGEMGFENEWRSRLAKMAWEDIKRHPLVGRGFSYTFDDIVAAVSTVGQSKQDALYEGLALSGGYHDGILTMAAFCGVPAAATMVASMLSLFGIFVWKLRRQAPSPLKMFSVGVAGTFVASFVQMATNGSGPSIYIVCALMAVMNGTLSRLRQEEAARETNGESAIMDLHVPVRVGPRALALNNLPQ